VERYIVITITTRHHHKDAPAAVDMMNDFFPGGESARRYNIHQSENDK